MIRLLWTEGLTASGMAGLIARDALDRIQVRSDDHPTAPGPT